MAPRDGAVVRIREQTQVVVRAVEVRKTRGDDGSCILIDGIRWKITRLGNRRRQRLRGRVSGTT